MTLRTSSGRIVVNIAQKRAAKAQRLPWVIRRYHSSSLATQPPPKEPQLRSADLGGPAKIRLHADEFNRDLFLDVLNASTTKRDVKQYISRFDSSKEKKTAKIVPPQKSETDDARTRSGVNLGNLYAQTRAVAEQPIFTQVQKEQEFVKQASSAPHVALIVVREPSGVGNNALSGIGKTLAQLSRLGLHSIVVLDGPKHKPLSPVKAFRDEALREADRVVRALSEGGDLIASRSDGLIELKEGGDSHQDRMHHGPVRLLQQDLLLRPLRQGITPVIPALGVLSSTQASVPNSADDIVLALAKDLTGLSSLAGEERSDRTQSAVVHRIIILDKHGGIPSRDLLRPLHVFINLEQEYATISKELDGWIEKKDPAPYARVPSKTGSIISANGMLAPLGVDNEDATCEHSREHRHEDMETAQSHLSNITLLNDILAFLPATSSGLLTTPSEAAQLRHKSTSSSMPGVATRIPRNPIIHNLLTDKPAFSSSLPRSRLVDHPSPRTHIPPVSPSTFLKKGMPVTIFPGPRQTPWKPPSTETPPFQLTDARIDLARLVHLIEDSFDRPLDFQHYLARVSSNLAGIIVAGQYEGGAILTWETPPSRPSNPNPEPVPYLDKFAVLQKAQGAGGVADIVFSVMVRDCFPNGVVWRSRQDNPVNKWYFERSKGCWKMPVRDGDAASKGNKGWTMFWTTEDVSSQRLMDYEAVCRGVGTSWANGRRE